MSQRGSFICSIWLDICFIILAFFLLQPGINFLLLLSISAQMIFGVGIFYLLSSFPPHKPPTQMSKTFFLLNTEKLIYFFFKRSFGEKKIPKIKRKYNLIQTYKKSFILDNYKNHLYKETLNISPHSKQQNNSVSYYNRLGIVLHLVFKQCLDNRPFHRFQSLNDLIGQGVRGASHLIVFVV